MGGIFVTLFLGLSVKLSHSLDVHLFIKQPGPFHTLQQAKLTEDRSVLVEVERKGIFLYKVMQILRLGYLLVFTVQNCTCDCFRRL